jgi:hypothetical protein
MFCENATHEGDGDIEQEEAEYIDSVKLGGAGYDDCQRGSPDTGLSLRQVIKNTSSVQEGGRCCIGVWQSREELHNALHDRVKRRVLKLARMTCAGCNTQPFTPASQAC